MFDYTAQQHDELSIKVGEILEVWSEEAEEGWWKVCNDCAHLCMYICMYTVHMGQLENDNRMEVVTVSLHLVFVKITFLLPIRFAKLIKWD